MPSPDPVADLLGRLERALVAPRRRRRELVREIEGDLREDVAARVDAGMPEPAAAAAVAAEFGDPRSLGTELSMELLADRGRRFATFGAIGTVTLLGSWALAMTALVGLGLRIDAGDGWMLQVSRALDVAGPLVVAVAVAGWIAIRRSGSMAAIAAVASVALGFALALVAGAIAMVGAVTVPSAGVGVFAALLAVTMLLGTAIMAASAGVLLRWGAIRLEPRRARS